MPELFTAENGIALLTLTALEIVLGIDNLVVIAILSARLPEEQRAQARRLGLAGAMIMRLALLFSLSWLMGMTQPLFTLLDHDLTVRDLILLAGGLFLIAKATHEIHTKVAEPDEHPQARKAVAATLGGVVGQIMLFDLVFSIDSVVTAVGMARAIWVMVVAIVLAVVTMMIFANPVSEFVEKRPSVKILALSFLILIGVLLVAEGLGQHLDRGYVYFAMAFSLVVEMINLRAHGRRRAR